VGQQAEDDIQELTQLASENLNYVFVIRFAGPIWKKIEASDSVISSHAT